MDNQKNEAGPSFQGFIEFKDSVFDGEEFPYLEWAEVNLAKLIVENSDIISWGIREKTYHEEVEHSCDFAYVSYIQDFFDEKKKEI